MAPTPSSFSVFCPQCKAPIQAKSYQVDTRITCPDCLEEFVITIPEKADVGTELDAEDPFADLFSQADGVTRETSDPLLDLEGDSDHGHLVTPGLDIDEIPVPATSRDEPYDFSVACPLCGTRQDTVSEQIGRKLRCPDCHSTFVVREPTRSARRPRSSKPEPLDSELQLVDLIPSAVAEPADDLPSSAAKDPWRSSAPNRSAAPTPNDVIQQTLRQATEEVEALEQQQSALPAKPFATGVLRFLSYPGTIGRWLIMSLTLNVEWGAIQTAIATAEGGPFEQFFSVLARVFASIFGVLFTCFLCTSLVVIVQQSSQGRDVMEGWPGINVVEWFFESWPVLASLFVALAPGFAIGQMAYQLSGDFSWFWWIGLGCGAPSFALVFPILILSFLENSSPYSRPIWRSLVEVPRYWCSFWLWSGGLVFVGGILGIMRMLSSSTVMSVMLAALLMLVVLIYFRLLGRLSWAADEALTRLDNARAAVSSAQQ